jgi:hypothetical protein
VTEIYVVAGIRVEDDGSGTTTPSIADRPIDITKIGWGLRLKQSPHPLDEAGVRPEAETLLQELINVYRASGEDERETVRKLFEEYRAFAWAASLPFEPTTEENFRQHLLLFSIKDQGRDSRMRYCCSKTYAKGQSRWSEHRVGFKRRSHSIQ